MQTHPKPCGLHDLKSTPNTETLAIERTTRNNVFFKQIVESVNNAKMKGEFVATASFDVGVMPIGNGPSQQIALSLREIASEAVTTFNIFTRNSQELQGWVCRVGSDKDGLFTVVLEMVSPERRAELKIP